ncbi:alpha/beta fold hydrolase [Streptomyces sp. NPDC048491]|uniref:thioesterase II family protein n=1 Tax=unclassified Streptomyces TaxID=2593676 RepID=UPI003420E7BF
MSTDTTPGTSAWIRRFHTGPRGAPALVCLPHAGGSASYFFPVSRRLSSVADVLAIQYPGRQDRRREPCLDSVDALADALTEELRPLRGVPLVLFGHSLGATVAFETARRLEAEGAAPLALFASGRRAPSTVRDERVHLKDDEALIADIARLDGTHDQVLGDEEVMRMILPAIRADYRAAETYRYVPGPALTCPVTVLTGDADPHVTSEEAHAWRRHTTGAFEVEVFPGGHFFLNSHAPAVMTLIEACLRPT